MKFIEITSIFFTVTLAGSMVIGGPGSNPIHDEVIERRALTDEELAVWMDQAECMETESKASEDIQDLNATSSRWSKK